MLKRPFCLALDVSTNKGGGSFVSLRLERTQTMSTDPHQPMGYVELNKKYAFIVLDQKISELRVYNIIEAILTNTDLTTATAQRGSKHFLFLMECYNKHCTAAVRS